MFFYHKRADNCEEENSKFPIFLEKCRWDTKHYISKAILLYQQLLACTSNFSKEELLELSLFLCFRGALSFTFFPIDKIKKIFHISNSSSLKETQEKIANYFGICLNDISYYEIPFSLFFDYPEYQFYQKGIFQFLKAPEDFEEQLKTLFPSCITNILLHNGHPLCEQSPYKEISNLDENTKNYLNLSFELYVSFRNSYLPINLFFVLAYLRDSKNFNTKEMQEIQAFLPPISWEELMKRFGLERPYIHDECSPYYEEYIMRFQNAILNNLKKLEKKSIPCFSLSIFLESLESCINFSDEIIIYKWPTRYGCVTQTIRFDFFLDSDTEIKALKGIQLLRERISYLYTFHMIEKPFQRFQDIPKEIEEKKKALLSMQLNSHISIYDLQKLRVSFENVILNLLMQTNLPFFSPSQDEIFMSDTIYDKILNLKLKLFHKEALPKKYNFQKVHEMVCNMDQSKIQEAITILESLLEFTEFFLKHYAEWVRLLQPHCEFSFSPSSLSLLRCLYMELQACLSEFTTSSLLECTDHYIENFCKNNIALKKKR